MNKKMSPEVDALAHSIIDRISEFESRSDAARELVAQSGDHFKDWASAKSCLQRRIEKRRREGKKCLEPKTTLKKRRQEQDEEGFKLDAWNDEGYMMDIDEYCLHYGLPREDIRSYKLVSHTGTPYYNILFREHMEVGVEITEEKIEEVFQKFAIVPATFPKVKKKKTSEQAFDRLIFTDAHVGMEPNENGHALYGGKWEEEEVMQSAERMGEELLARKTGSLLHIDELGDLVDGWNGETVRGGHTLPQNLDNEGQYDLAVSFKMHLLRLVVPSYDEIICHNMANDNHAGAFGYIVNSGFKLIAESTYPEKVKVYNHRSFIDHYYVGDHCFILCHGKDSKALKFGFKAGADLKGLEKIEDYIKANNIYTQAKHIEFSKGDSHQLIFDMSSSDHFSYMSYPALAPSSEWIQTNFKKGRRGFVIQTIKMDEPDKIISPIFI